MPNPPLDPATHKLIWFYTQQGSSIEKVQELLRDKHSIKISFGAVQKWRKTNPPGLTSNKKVGHTSWEEWSKYLEQGQNLKRKGSYSQDQATISIGDGSHPVCLGIFSDQHIGSWGCNYPLLRELTRELSDTPNFYVGLLGDIGQYSIKLRSVLEVADNQLPPEQQTAFITDWFSHIWHKVAFATWDNHAVERQEKQAGESSMKAMLSKKVPYFNGIGHVDLKVGNQVYKGAVSHKMRGSSVFNPCHGGVVYLQREGHDREWTMEGDRHKPGMLQFTLGDKVCSCINAGSLQLNSGYGKRYFSLTTHPAYPVFVFRHDRHEILPFWSLKQAISCGAMK